MKHSTGPERSDPMDRLERKAARAARIVAAALVGVSILVAAAFISKTRETTVRADPRHAAAGAREQRSSEPRRRSHEKEDEVLPYEDTTQKSLRVPIRVRMRFSRAAVAGARVLFSTTTDETISQSTTDAAGICCFDTPRDSTVRVRISVQGYADSVTTWKNVTTSDLREIEIIGDGTVDGIVEDAEGARLSGIPVSLRLDDQAAVTSASQDGSFSFSGVPLGIPLELVAGGDQWEPCSVAVVASPRALAKLVLRPQRLAEVVLHFPNLRTVSDAGGASVRICSESVLLYSSALMIASGTAKVTCPVKDSAILDLTVYVSNEAVCRSVHTEARQDGEKETIWAEAEFPEICGASLEFVTAVGPIGRRDVAAICEPLRAARIQTDDRGRATLAMVTNDPESAHRYFFASDLGVSSETLIAPNAREPVRIELGWRCSTVVISTDANSSPDVALEAEACPQIALLRRPVSRALEFAVIPGRYRRTEFGVAATAYDILVQGAGERICVESAGEGGEVTGRLSQPGKVTLYALRDNRRIRLATPVSDAAGRFLVRTLAVGRGLVTASFPNGATWSRAIEITPGAVTDVGEVSSAGLARLPLRIVAPDGEAASISRLRLQPFPMYLHEQQVLENSDSPAIWLEPNVTQFMIGTPEAFGVASRTGVSKIQLPSRHGESAVSFPAGAGVVTQVLWLKKEDGVQWFVELLGSGGNVFEMPYLSGEQHFIANKGNVMEFYAVPLLARGTPSTATAVPMVSIATGRIPGGARAYDTILEKLWGTDLSVVQWTTPVKLLGTAGLSTQLPSDSRIRVRFFDCRARLIAETDLGDAR